MDPVFGVIIAVLGVATGIFSSHATLGKDVRQALVEIKNLAREMRAVERRLDSLEADPRVLHFHRRASDDPDEAQG